MADARRAGLFDDSRSRERTREGMARARYTGKEFSSTKGTVESPAFTTSYLANNRDYRHSWCHVCTGNGSFGGSPGSDG